MINKIKCMDKLKILDTSIGNNCVLAFSLYKLRKNIKYCMRVRRALDDVEIDIDFLNNYINYRKIQSFSQGTNVFITTKYNQSKITNAKNAIQTTKNLQPRIANAGVFYTDGIRYAGTTHMTVENYAELNIINPSLSIYTNTIDSSYGFIFGLNDSATNNTQYGVYTNSTTAYCSLNGASKISDTDTAEKKNLFVWKGKNANELVQNLNNKTKTATYATELTSRTNFNIGAIAGAIDNSSVTANQVGYTKTILIFNNNQESNFTKIKAVC